MSEIKGIISDLDGTLVDTFEANFLAYQTVLSKYGIALTRESYRKGFGLRLTELLAALGGEFSPTEVAEIRDAKARCYPDFFTALRPNRPLLEFLRRFRAKAGRTALATTASRANVERVLRHIGAESLFEHVITGEDVKNGKPDPECYLVSCARLGLPANQILVFEDTELGLEAARRAGMAVLRITEAFYGT